MTCSQCGTDNPAGRRFCRECGQALSILCTTCGAPNDPGDKFCGNCGAKLVQDTPASPVEAPRGPQSAATDGPVAERRLVSVLFADLVGFTSLSETRDPEEVRELLSRYFEISRRFIARYGGTVEKFIGDAVMAVWGAPVATEDDAERAVRAALDLTAAVQALGEEVGAPELRARAGVLTGEAAVTLGAKGEGMVAGDLVNTASRIQSAAPPGGVFVGEATRRATESTIAYEDAGTFELKGKAGLVPLWRALRIVAGVRGTLRSQQLEAPFVGRDREMRIVKELYFGSVDEKKAQLVSVIGIAGIGKSRLVWEFYKYFDGLADDAFWHRGRCLSYGEGVTYWALAEMVKMRARILEEEEPASALTKLRATLEENVPDAEERRWIEPRLAHLLGLEDHTAADREDLFAAWRLFFERLSDQFPTILVFEDMQWADPSLLDFIEYLLEWSRSHPLFVITHSRPELNERRPNWGAGKRNFTSLYLEPLSPDAMHELMSGLVPGLPTEVVQQILDRAEGVPLYAVETVRMLIDRGLLVQEGSAYRPAGPIESLEVPETLQALIAARLDGLTADERRVVQDASVLGKTFFKQAAAQLMGITEAEIEPSLASLIRKEVLTVQADPRSPERGQYEFLQDLVRTVAYETIARKDRKAKHLAAASFIEQGWGGEEEEVVEVLAAHYLSAYEAAPDADDAHEIRGRARDLLSRAGERARSLAANAEALSLFERAARLTEEPLPLAELHERAGRSAWTIGRAEEAGQHFEASIEAFDSIGLTHPAARVSAALAEIMWQEGHVDAAVDRMSQAFDVMAGEEEDADLATLAAQLGRFLYFSGHPAEALERIERALAMAESLAIPEVLSHALNTRGLIISSQGRMQEGMLLIRHSLDVALEHDLSAPALRAYGNLGALASQMDRHQEVFALSEDAIALARKVGDRLSEASYRAGIIGEYLALGRWDEAASVASEMLEHEDAVRLQAVFLELTPILTILVHRGDGAEARPFFERLGFSPDSKDVQERTARLSAEALLLRSEGSLEEAFAAAEEAIAARSEVGIRFQAVKDAIVEAAESGFALGDLDRVERVLAIVEGLRPGDLSPYLSAQGARIAARLAVARGDDDRARVAFDAAARSFREQEALFWVAVTLLERAEALGVEEEDESLQEARGVFDRLKARPWLERADRVISSTEVGPAEADPDRDRAALG